MISKHKAMQDWVQQFLTNNYLYFENADAYPGVRTLVPNYGDYVINTDVLGFKYKSYTFGFIGYEKIDNGTSDVNTDNMDLFDKYIEWLEQQQKNQNFPDFGPGCDEYEIELTQNMFNIAAISEDNLAKYVFIAKINYKEE